MTKKQKLNLTTRKDIKAELDKQIAILKTNCKDAAMFDAQIDKILSLKGQLDTDATRVLVKEKDVIKEYNGDTFYIALTKKGVMLHTHGGYTMLVTERNYNSLYLTLASFLEDYDEENMSDEEKEAKRLDMMAKIHVLLAPTWCFGDAEATFNIATSVVHELNAMTKRYEEMPLMEEDENANADLQEAVEAAETIGKKLEEEKNGKS
ncbi:MAG: hypothetical protein II604_02955 [Bacteroidales bacterium]|nr:hypothetical protein [Bacteroidales bacterium]